MDLEIFRNRIKSEPAQDLTREIYLGDEAKHVSKEKLDYIKSAFSRKFKLPEERFKIYVVGSAKLGFSLTQKTKDNITRPRYRSYDAESDVDLAVVSTFLFHSIWSELSEYSHRDTLMPRDNGKLADYMVYGWLRPDYFPTQKRLFNCDNWWSLFHELSSNVKFNRRKIRGGLFFAERFMLRYYERSMDECKRFEEISA